MALNELFLVTVFARLRSQQIVNTFTYAQTDVGDGLVAPALNLSNLFDLEFFTSGSGFRGPHIGAGVTYEAFRVQSLFTPANFHEEIFNPVLAGEGAGLGASNFEAYGFRTQWLGGQVRRGFKRIAGVLDASLTSGVLTVAAQASMDALAVKFGTYLFNASGGFKPVIVKRIKEVDPVTGKVTYRLPDSTDAPFWVADLTWQAASLVTTQNSRKIGRGA